MPEPRHQGEYEGRQTIAARRVLIDMGQVLAAFRTQMVIVGGWVPELGLNRTTRLRTSAALMLIWPWTFKNSQRMPTPK